MFTVNVIQLVGIIVGSAIGGGLLGFFAAAILAAGGRSSDEEERWEWRGEVKR